jgi:hypothetical protein
VGPKGTRCPRSVSQFLGDFNLVKQSVKSALSRFAVLWIARLKLALSIQSLTEIAMALMPTDTHPTGCITRNQVMFNWDHC